MDQLNNSMVLGIDFITKANIIINGRDRKVVMVDQVIQKTFTGQGREMEELEFSYGKVTKKVEIPGYAIKEIPVTGKPGKTYMCSMDAE